MPETIKTVEKLICFHCGDECANGNIHIDKKYFCCEGCKLVYEIINQNDLCQYYDIEHNPGITQKIKVRPGKFAFLDDEKIQSKLLTFKEGNTAHVTFYLPQMHCSSCIWLLENLNKIGKGIISSQVNFLKKEVFVAYNPTTTSLKKVAETLTMIGYEPHIN